MNTDAKQIAARFENESERAKQIASERGKFWACHLAVELLNSHLKPIKKAFDELQNGQSYKPTSRIVKKEAFGWLICKTQDLRNLATHLQSLICNDFVVSLNSESQEKVGNPIAILEATKKISTAGRNLISWEEEIRLTILPDKIQPAQKALYGSTAQYFNELNSLAVKIEAPLKKAKPSKDQKLKIAFKEPRQMVKFNEELSVLMTDMEKNPHDWIGWA